MYDAPSPPPHTHTQDIGDGWWEGELANGVTGLFPESYVEASLDICVPMPACGLLLLYFAIYRHYYIYQYFLSVCLLHVYIPVRYKC